MKFEILHLFFNSTNVQRVSIQRKRIAPDCQ